MNQYDFIEQDNGPRKRILVLILCAIVALGLMMFAVSCSEKEPPPTLDEQLQGAWQREWLTLTNRYNFHGGACDVYSIIPAQPYQYYAYAYATEGDTLTMLDLACGNVRRAVVSFHTDSTAVLAWIGGVEYHLKRI